MSKRISVRSLEAQVSPEQREKIEETVEGARRSLREAAHYTVESDEHEEAYAKNPRTVVLDGLAKVVYSLDTSYDTVWNGNTARVGEHPSEEKLKVTFMPKDGDETAVAFDFLRDPVQEVLALAGRLCVEGEPIEPKTGIDTACQLITEATTSITG